MTCRIAQWTIDAVNVEATARFWAAALDLELHAGSDGLPSLTLAQRRRVFDADDLGPARRPAEDRQEPGAPRPRRRARHD